MASPTGPPAPYDEPRSKRSGCMVALYILFGLGLLVVVGGGAAIYLFLQTEEGQRLAQGVKRGAEWVAVASQAPGTAELREAGCEAAMVSEAGEALDIILTTVFPEQEKRDEARAQLESEAGQANLDELLLVICTLPRFTTEQPGCDELARTYTNAVDRTPDSFYVMVMQQGQNEPSCQGIYSPGGQLLHEPAFE